MFAGAVRSLKNSWLRIFLQWFVISLQQVYLPTQGSRLRVRANGKWERETAAEWKREKEGKKEKMGGWILWVSADRNTQVLSNRTCCARSLRMFVIVCWLECCSVCTVPRGNRHLTKALLCVVVQQLNTERETKIWVKPACVSPQLCQEFTLWCMLLTCRTSRKSLRQALRQNNLIADFTSCMGVLVCCDCFFYRY